MGLKPRPLKGLTLPAGGDGLLDPVFDDASAMMEKA